MSILAQEVRLVQNPALGAVLIWRFAAAFTGSHAKAASPQLPLAFLVLPIMLSSDLLNLVSSTQRASGLHGFAAKFSTSESAQSDLLLSIQSRANEHRDLTLSSLRHAVAHRLVTVTASDARVIPLTTTAPSAVAQSVQPLLRASDKLGHWCSQLSLFEIASSLKVQL